MEKELIETWLINNRANLYLLDAIDETHLEDVSASKGRSVGAQFAHIHNVRLMWLKVSAPELMKGLKKFEKETKLSKKLLSDELVKSANAIAIFLEKSFREGRVKNFKPHPSAFFGYMISHESHHRGQIMLALNQSAHAVSQKVQYGLWEWGKL